MTQETIPLADTDIEEELKGNLLLGSVADVLNWARSSSLWPVMFGLACCAIEMIATANARYDIAQPPPPTRTSMCTNPLSAWSITRS